MMQRMLLALFICTLAACGGGGSGGSNGSSGGNTPTVVAQAGASTTTTSNVDVTLSSSDVANGRDIASYSWQQISGPTQPNLSNTNASTATFDSLNTTTNDIIVTFRVTITETGGAVTNHTATITIQGRLTVSGAATYDYVPHHEGTGANQSGLNYNNISQRPIRKGYVDVRDFSTGEIYSSGQTNDMGSFSLTAPQNKRIRVAFRACSTNAMPASWNVCVVNNLANDSLWTVTFASPAALTADYTGLTPNLISGWNNAGNRYDDSRRQAGPWAILDSIVTAMDAVVAADANVILPELKVRWHPANTSSGAANSNANIGTSHYSSSTTTISILGLQDVDTDEYDHAVVQHEWCHYLTDKLSRSDNLGGPHGGEQLDLRIAFDEGFCNAFAGMVENDPLYRDSLGNDQQVSGTTIRLETSTPPHEGYADEEAIAVLAYDLFDPANDDASAFGFQGIYNALTSPQLANTDAFIGVYPFLSALATTSSNAGDVTTTAATRNINSIDEFAVGETNNYGLPSLLQPLYDPLTTGTPVNVCSRNNVGHYNKLANRSFLKFDATMTAAHTITVTATNAGNPTAVVWHKGQVTGFRRVNGNLNFNVNLTAGNTYVIEVYEDRHVHSSAPVETKCFNVEIN